MLSGFSERWTIWDIERVESSPFAIPADRMAEIKGETSMSWTAFAGVMDDGKSSHSGQLGRGTSSTCHRVTPRTESRKSFPIGMRRSLCIERNLVSNAWSRTSISARGGTPYEGAKLMWSLLMARSDIRAVIFG